MLTHFGAEVVKVEDASSGDYWRLMGSFYNMPSDELENPLFDQYNSGKRDIGLNLKTEESLEALLKLLERADVFIVNLREQSLQRLGLDYESLKERFPRLIYAQITGYGDTGPDKDLPSTPPRSGRPPVLSTTSRWTSRAASGSPLTHPPAWTTAPRAWRCTARS